MSDVALANIKRLLVEERLLAAPALQTIGVEVPCAPTHAEIMRFSPNLKSSFFQWPHHHWIPKKMTPTIKSELDNMLLQADPMFIIFTTPPKNARQEKARLLKYIKGFQKEFKKEEIKIYFLDKNKSLKVAKQLFFSTLRWAA